MKSILKKIGSTLGSLLLSFNIGCNSLSFQNSDYQERQNLESVCLDEKPNPRQPIVLEQELETYETVPAEPRKVKKWQYPVNVLGGFMTHIFVHEGGHALAALAQGVGIEEFHPYPGFVDGEFFGGWVMYERESYYKTSPEQRAIMSIAGPAADMALAEIINYNLRNGKVSPKYQPFWATTSLIARGGPLWIAIGSLKGKGMNDFSHLEIYTGVPKETWAGLVGLYTVLNAKRIVKEFKVALGKDTYDYKPKKGELNLVPYKDGLMVNYTLNF